MRDSTPDSDVMIETTLYQGVAEKKRSGTESDKELTLRRVKKCIVEGVRLEPSTYQEPPSLGSPSPQTKPNTQAHGTPSLSKNTSNWLYFSPKKVAKAGEVMLKQTGNPIL